MRPEPDLSDDAELARQLRRERAVAAAASAPGPHGKGAPRRGARPAHRQGGAAHGQAPPVSEAG